MKFIDILTFLVPSDLFQIFFLFLLLTASVVTIVLVHVNGTPASWQERWENKNHKLNLDVEHGSVLEMSQAVSTTPERVAEIMPTLLLVVGLLGTFIGIGLALNSASSILASVKSSSMDHTMSELMFMMQGLGTKFKTSTWGIIGYLCFKAWETTNNFEEKRLRWCVEKMNEQIHAQRLEKKEREEALYFLIKDSIEQLGQKIISTHSNEPSLGQQIQISMEKLEQRILSSTAPHDSLGQLIQEAIEKQSLELKEHISFTDDQFYQRYKIHFEIVKNKFTDVNDKLQEIYQLIAERSRQMHQSLQLMTGLMQENHEQTTKLVEPASIKIQAELHSLFEVIHQPMASLTQLFHEMNQSVLYLNEVNSQVIQAAHHLANATERFPAQTELRSFSTQFEEKSQADYAKGLIIFEQIQHLLEQLKNDTTQHLTTMDQHSCAFFAQTTEHFTTLTHQLETILINIDQLNKNK